MVARRRLLIPWTRRCIRCEGFAAIPDETQPQAQVKSAMEEWLHELSLNVVKDSDEALKTQVYPFPGVYLKVQSTRLPDSGGYFTNLDLSLRWRCSFQCFSFRYWTAFIYHHFDLKMEVWTALMLGRIISFLSDKIVWKIDVIILLVGSY